ncbi:MAG: hypothetical protein E7069_05080 [Bacteroidales bacterium]|jgi:hypothetical protein|nr:hypothetical protein [Bacteroidales bacterium]
MKKFILLSLVSLCLCGCPICYDDSSIDIYIENNSEDTIAAISKLHYSYKGNRDTVLSSRNMREIVSSDSIREWVKYGETDFGNACYLIEDHYDFDTLSIFILSYSTYKTKTWEQIAKDYDILARYDITNENVESRVEGDYGKIVLPYPPNEEIADIYTYIPKK